MKAPFEDEKDDRVAQVVDLHELNSESDLDDHCPPEHVSDPGISNSHTTSPPNITQTTHKQTQGKMT